MSNAQKQGSQASAARRWWWRLQDYGSNGEPNPLRDRAALARLRRVSTPMDAAEEPEVTKLYDAFQFSRHQLTDKFMRVAVIASVLAHIRPPPDRKAPAKLAVMLGEGDQPVMSALRFRSLLIARSDQELLTAFRRAVALAGSKGINVGDVAESLLDWSDERRVLWAFDYYGAYTAAPDLLTAKVRNSEAPLISEQD